MKRCKNCLIPEGKDIVLNSKKICNLCLTQQSLDNSLEKRKLKEEFEEYIKKIKGQNKYDCVLLFSGGKDSTYLLKLLKEEYDLKILTVTIDNGLEPSFNKNNIKKYMDFFNVDNITITPGNNLYKKLYHYIILNPDTPCYSASVCSLCQKIIKSIGLNIAAKKGITLVLGAYSPEQGLSSECPKEILSKSWVPNYLYNEEFTEGDRSFFWDPNRYATIPRLIHPFYFLEYPSKDKIIKELASIGINKKKYFNPLRTNCDMMWLTIYLDLTTCAENVYVKYLYRQIRLGLTNRLLWKFLLPFCIWFLKNGLIKRKQIKHALKFADLTLIKVLK